MSNVWSRRSLGRKSQLFSLLGFDVETNSGHKPPPPRPEKKQVLHN